MGIVAVTGAAGALGQAACAHLRAVGWQVVGIDKAPVPSASVDLALSGIDLTEEAGAAPLAAHIKDALGGLDGLVNIAGGFVWETVTDGSIATWDRLYMLNVKTAVITTRALLPLLKDGGGSIVNIGANAATKATAGMGAYTASKAGVARLTEALAEEYKDEGVRVNAILPSILDTAINRADMPDAEFDRWVKPEQLASVVEFLLSDKADAITGALIPVTGRV